MAHFLGAAKRLGRRFAAAVLADPAGSVRAQIGAGAGVGAVSMTSEGTVA